jgi:hypothetical protein
MDFSWMELLASFGAGMFGAAIGALPAFILMGLVILLGTMAAFGGSSFDVINSWGFGPLFGPHISFAGGVAAAAFAGSRDWLDDGKDILPGLAGLDKPIVLVVGGVFGAIGYLINVVLAGFIGDYTDTIALTVVLSAMIARLIFGETGLVSGDTDAKESGRFTPSGDAVWVGYQQDWIQIITISIGASIISAWMALAIEPIVPGAANFVGFGLSAFSLIFFQFGGEIPMTHHITIIAALGATTTGSLLFGVVMGILSGILAEISSRLFLIRGDTHIDPPANAIWVMTTVVILIGMLF